MALMAFLEDWAGHQDASRLCMVFAIILLLIAAFMAARSKPTAPFGTPFVLSSVGLALLVFSLLIA